MAPTTTHLSPAELAYLHASLSSTPPIRPDARYASDFRPFSAETGILSNTMGSAHVGFADGREAVVGIRAEVERSAKVYASVTVEDGKRGADVEMADVNSGKERSRPQGKASWVTVTLSLSGMRDDDKDLIFLEEMLREVLVAPSTGSASMSLQDALYINLRWHWHLYIDVVLISPPSAALPQGSYPLPLLSMAIYMALRDTRIPRLKSEGEEDPLADDDWEASTWLYAKKSHHKYLLGGAPPVTLLVVVVGENVIFDPAGSELAVADAVFAISLAQSQDEDKLPTLLGVRMLETGARDTMRGVPNKTNVKEWEHVPGVWRPKVGGVKRNILKQAVKATLGETGKEILQSLEGFVAQAG